MNKLALVGCAHIHTPGSIRNIAARKDVKITAVWDHDAARAKKNADAIGASVVADLEQIAADPAIEAAVVYTETNRHEQVVLRLANARKHLFVEKPLGLRRA